MTFFFFHRYSALVGIISKKFTSKKRRSDAVKEDEEDAEMTRAPKMFLKPEENSWVCNKAVPYLLVNCSYLVTDADDKKKNLSMLEWCWEKRCLLWESFVAGENCCMEDIMLLFCAGVFYIFVLCASVVYKSVGLTWTSNKFLKINQCTCL